MLGFSAVLRRLVHEGALQGDGCAKASALRELIDALDQLHLKDARRLCEEMRAGALIEDVAASVGDSDPSVHQPALMLVTMLTTLEVDSEADATLVILRDSGLFVHVLPHLHAADALTIALACGACQNACYSDLELVHVLETRGDIDRIHELARCDEPSVAQAASACLHNIEATIALATRAFDAIVRLQRASRRRIDRARANRQRRSLCCHSPDIARAARCLSGGLSSPREPPSLVWT